MSVFGLLCLSIPITLVCVDENGVTHNMMDMLENWDFLKPYKHTVLRMDGTADCVLVRAEGKPTLAVCMEGYSYARYVALVLEEETPTSDLRKG